MKFNKEARMYLFICLLLGSMVLKSHQLELADCGDTYRSPGRLFVLTLYYDCLNYHNILADVYHLV